MEWPFSRFNSHRLWTTAALRSWFTGLSICVVLIVEWPSRAWRSTRSALAGVERVRRVSMAQFVG